MVRLSPVLFRPIAADDVAAILAEVVLAAPRNGIVEIAGPERAPFNEIIGRYLKGSATRVRSCATPRPDTGAAGSRSARSCRWARRAADISASTNGCAAHRQKPDAASEVHPQMSPLTRAGWPVLGTSRKHSD